MKRFMCALLIIAGVVSLQPAFALPGDSIGTVVAGVKLKPFKVTSNISELGGNRVYQAYATYRGRKLGFFFQDAQGRSFEENIEYPSVIFINRSDPRVRDILALVYDSQVAADYVRAKLTATAGVFQSKDRITFFRGRRFGYSASGSHLTILRLADLKQSIENAKLCATRECGD